MLTLTESGKQIPPYMAWVSHLIFFNLSETFLFRIKWHDKNTQAANKTYQFEFNVNPLKTGAFIAINGMHKVANVLKSVASASIFFITACEGSESLSISARISELN